MKKVFNCSVIIVAHNSQMYIDTCLEALLKQSTMPQSIIIIDSGSVQKDYLLKYKSHPTINVYFADENIGFCKGNNKGMAYIPQYTDFVLFLNPDAFLTPHFIAEAINFMEKPTSKYVGALSGLLLGFDIITKQATGKVDSAGIFQKWYGKWYDKAQGKDYFKENYTENVSVPALCGALLFCRMSALQSVLLAPHEVMDPSFFMYKEDIDLSLRLRKQGWSLMRIGGLIAYHCRGWKNERSKIPKQFKLMSAKNELRLHARLFSPCLFYSLLKYCAVKMFNI